VSSGNDGQVVGAVVGSLVALGAIVASGVTLASTASAREAAHVDAMNACLRPALLIRQFGPEHSEVAYSLHALGYRYYGQQEYATAERLYLRALAIQEKALGADASEVANILDDYAALLNQTARLLQAIELKQRARAAPSLLEPDRQARRAPIGIGRAWPVLTGWAKRCVGLVRREVARIAHLLSTAAARERWIV
jgi:tetratricopeptide (TPR) repeat protein